MLRWQCAKRHGGRGHDAEEQRKAADDLRPEEFAALPLRGDAGREIEAKREGGEADEEHLPRIDHLRKARDERRDEHLRKPRDEDGLADLPRVITSDAREEERQHVDAAEKPEAGDENEEARHGKGPALQNAQVDDGAGISQRAPDEEAACHDGEPGEIANDGVVEPVPAVAFLQHVFEAAERDGEQEQADPVEFFQEREIGFIDRLEERDGEGDDEAGHEVDEEQPVPGKDVGDPAAKRGPDGRSQATEQAEDGGHHGALLAGEKREAGGEDGRDHRAADKALDGARGDHRVDVPREAARHAGDGEAGRRGGEEPAGGERAGEPAGEGNHDDFADEVGGLHPPAFVRRGGEAGLDVGDGGGDDLRIEQRHELADGHEREEKEFAAIGHGIDARGAHKMTFR